MSSTTIEKLEVNGKKYILEDCLTLPEPKNSNIKIVVLQRGWVMIGRWSQDGDMCELENAYVIRTWGTTKGLGELALDGKQDNTKLDKAGHVQFHILTVIAQIDCVEAKWNDLLV